MTSGRFASATSEKMPSTFFLSVSIPTQSLCSGRWFFAKQSDFVDESAIQVEPSISLNCFKSLPLRNRPARGRGQTWRNTLRPDIGNHIEQPGSVAEARDRPFVALFLICRVPDPYSAIALRASDCLLRSHRSPLRLSFLSEVGFLSLCPRSSAVGVRAFAVRAVFQLWSASWRNALHSGVAVAEERSTHYDTPVIALVIIVSPDTPGAPALAFGQSHLQPETALSVVVNHSA